MCGYKSRAPSRWGWFSSPRLKIQLVDPVGVTGGDRALLVTSWLILCDPPWNFLYEMVGVNPQKRNQNDIVFLSFFGRVGCNHFVVPKKNHKPICSDLVFKKCPFSFGRKIHKPNCRHYRPVEAGFQENSKTNL